MKSTRRVIVNDSPTGACLLDDERENAGRYLATKLESEAPPNEGVVRAEKIDGQLVERQAPNLLALPLILLLVTLERGFPAEGLLVSRIEAQLIAFPIALHETAQVF